MNPYSLYYTPPHPVYYPNFFPPPLYNPPPQFYPHFPNYVPREDRHQEIENKPLVEPVISDS